MSTFVVRIRIRINKSYLFAIMTDRNFFSFGCFYPLSNLFFLRKKSFTMDACLPCLVWGGRRKIYDLIYRVNKRPFYNHNTRTILLYYAILYRHTFNAFVSHTHAKNHSMHICLGKVHKNCIFFQLKPTFDWNWWQLTEMCFLYWELLFFIVCGRKQFKS